jgi:hypothetical protein
MKAHKTIGTALALVLGLAMFVPGARAGTDVEGNQFGYDPLSMFPYNPGYLIPPTAKLNCKPQPNETVICADGNQMTEFNFAVPVKLPGNTIFPPGTYRFVLSNWDADTNTVMILNDRWDPVKTLETIPIERSKPTVESMLAFVGEPGQLPALTKWFFHGQTEGHEFVYPGREEKVFSEEPEVTILAQMNPGSAIKSANLNARASY